MAGIQFDFTGDNSSFIKTVEQVQSSIQHTTKVLGEVGKYFDVSNVVDQIDALTRTIRSNEESISNSKKQIADWMKQAEEARNIGDFATSDVIQLDISKALNDIETYNKDIEDTKRALLEIMNIGGEGKAPMLFDTQEDYDKVQRLKEEIVDLQSQIANFNGSDEALEGLRGKLSATEEELRKMELSAAQNAQSLGAAASVASEASNHYYELTNKIKEQEAVVAELTLKFYDAEQAMKKALASNNVQDISAARVQYDAYAKGLEQARHQLISLNNEQEKFHKKMQQMANGVSEASSKIVTAFKNIAAVAGVSFTLNQAKKFVDEVVSIRSAMQDLESSTKIFLGSAQAASNFNEQLKSYSMKSLFHYNELMAVSHQLLGIGMSSEEAMHKIDQLANIAAATHASLSSVVGMYTRASAMGSVMNRQLVSWQNLGVNVKQVLKDMGEDVTKTSVSFEQLQKVIDHVTAPGGKFANAQQDMLGNISAEIDTYKNKMELMFNEIGEDYQEYIVGAIKGGQWLIENYKEIGTVIMDCIAAYGAYRAAIIAVAAAHKLGAFWETASTVATKINTAAKTGQVASVTTSTVAWRLATASIKQNTTAMLANAAAAVTNPYVLLGAAIAALTFGVYKLATADDAETAARKRANEEAKKYNDTLEERRNRMMELVHTVQDKENNNEEARNVAWQQLKDEFPDLVSGYNQATFAALSFNQAQKEVNQVVSDEKFEKAKSDVEKYKKELKELKDRYEDQKGLSPDAIDFNNYVKKSDIDYVTTLLKDAEEEFKKLEEARNKVLEPKDIKDLSFEELLDGYAEASEKIDEINGKEVNPNIDTEKIREAVGWANGMIVNLKLIDETKVKTGVNYEQLVDARDKASSALAAIQDIDKEVADPEVKREKIEEAERKARTAIDELENLGKIVAKPQVEATGLEKTLSKVRELWGYLKKILGKGEEPAKAPVKNTKGQTASKGDFRKQVQEKINAAETDEDVDNLITTLNKKKKKAKYGSEERSFYEKKLTELQAKKKKNGTKSGGTDGSKRKQGTLDDELKQLQEQFKTEQERRRSLAELRIAQIQNEAVKEQEAQKEASRQKWESIASEELSAYKKLYDDAKKQFELKNKNKNRVFADTAEAKEIMDGIRAYVNYYSQRNNLARTANEELEKTNGGIKVFDEAKLDTSKEKLAGLLDLLKGIQDKKVVVESETKDMTKVEVTGDVDDVKAIKQMATEDTSFTVTMKVEQIGSIEIPKDKTFTVTGRYEGADLADITKKVNSLPKTAETVINTSLGKIQKADINENATVEVETVVDSKQYDELVKKLGKDAVQKVTTEVTGDEIPTVENKTMAVRIRVDKSKIDDLKKSVPSEMPVKIYSDAKDFKMPKIKDKVTVDVNYKVNSDELDNVKHPKGGTITYNTDVKGLDTIEKLGDKNVKITATVDTDKVQNFSQAVAAVPTEKIVTIGIEQVGELPQVEDKMFTVTGHYDGSETDKIKEIPSKANVLVTTKVDSKQYDDLAKRFKGNVSILVDVNDKKALEQLQGIKNLHIDPKEVVFRADNKDALQAAKEIQGVHIDEQTMKVYADTEEAMKKLTAMNGMTLQPKTLSVTADTKKAKNDLMAVDGLVKDKKMSVVIKTTGDKLPEVKGDDTVTYTYKANTKELEEVTPPQDSTITYTVKVQGQEALQGLKVPADQTYTVTMALEKVGSIEMPKDGTFTISAHLQGEEELKKITELPKEADVTINTKLGDIKEPDIPTDATIEVTTEVSAADYEKLKAQLGEDAVQVIHTKVEGDAVPQVKDQTMTVHVKTDKTGLTNLQNVVGKDVTAKVNTKAGKVNLPKIDKNATVDVKYNVDSTQVDEAAEKLHDGTVTYHVNVEGKEKLDALGDKSISIRVDASREAQAQAKLLGEAFKQSVISAQQLSDAGLDKSFIDKLKNGTYSADELARAIVLLQNAIDGLDKNSEKYKGLYNSLDDDTKAILKNKEALESANDANTDRERQKKRLEDMRQYFEQYGSLEQKRQAIIEKFEKDIKEAREAGQEGQARILEEELKDKKAQMSIENITKGIDWGSLFNGIGTMSKEMMKQTRKQLQVYINSDQFRNSGAENQQKVIELMNQIKEYLGSEDVGWKGLGDAMADFNNAVVTLEQAQNKQKDVLEEYLKAKQAKDEAEEKKKNGTISEEAYNAAIDAYNEASMRFNKAGKAVKDAEQDVQSFGSKLNAASDSVVNFVSKLDVQLKEMEGVWGRFSGFSDLQNISSGFSSLSGQLGKAAAEEQAKRIANAQVPDDIKVDDGLGNTIDPNVLKEAFAEPAGAIEKALGNLSNISSGIGNTVGKGISGLLGSASSLVGGVLALPSMIVQTAKAIKEVVTGILDGVTEFLRLEWLSDLIVSIANSIANVVDAVFDLPESIAHALEAIISGLGGSIGNIVGRVGSVFGLDLFGESHESDETYEEDMKMLNSTNERLIESIDRLAGKMEQESISGKLELYEKQLKNLETLTKNTEEQLDRSFAAYKSASSGFLGIGGSSGEASAATWIMEELNTDELKRLSTWANDTFFEEYADAKEKGEAYALGYNKYENGYKEALSNIDAQTWKEIYENDTALWNRIMELAARGHQDASGYLKSFMELSDRAEELKDELLTSVTTISFDGMIDSFSGALLSMEEDATDTSKTISETMSKALINSMVNDKYAEKLKKWREKVADALDAKDYNRLEKLKKEYQGWMDEAKEYADEIKSATGYTEASNEKTEQKATFNSAKNITYEQADALVGVAMAQQIILEQIKAWLYKQNFDKTDEEQIPIVEIENTPLQEEFVDGSKIDEIVELLKQESGDDLQKASEALYAAAKQRMQSAVELGDINLPKTDNEELAETMAGAISSLGNVLGEKIDKTGDNDVLPPTIDVNVPVEEKEESADYTELLNTFSNSYGKLMVGLKSVAAKVGMNIPATSLQSFVPQQTFDNMLFKESLDELLSSIQYQIGEKIGTDNGREYDMSSLQGMLVESSIANEQNTAQVMLISQNLQALKDMTTSNSIVVSEIRNLVMEGNSVRESILKVMRERYESFDSKLTQIYRELQAQG